MLIEDVSLWLPQGPPMLMLDRIVDLEPGKRGVGMRKFRAGDACFAGHFPDHPIVPGVMLIEAFAQTALVVLATEHGSTPPQKPEIGFLAKVDGAAFYQSLSPDDEVSFHVSLHKRLRQFVTMQCHALRAERKVCKATLTLVGSQ